MRFKTMTAIAVTVVLCWTTAARAELWKDMARGMALFDFQFSGEKNVLGDGITVNAGANWVNREFNFGVADLTLTGSVAASAGYTLRGIPSADFSLNTGGAPLAYTFKTNNGFQNVTANGNVLVNIDTDVNAMGFYEKTLQVSNRGTVDVDGVGAEGSQTLDYDVGPIVVTGNVFYDALTALASPFYAATGTENPLAKYSPLATKQKEAEQAVEGLQSRMEAGQTLNEEEMATLINNSVLAAMLGTQPSGELFNSVIAPEGLLQDTAHDPRTSRVLGALVQQVPEPITFGLMALGLLFWYPRRPGRDS